MNLVDILAAAKANDDEASVQPNRGNKTSKKNKKKNKNQDWEDESEGIIFLALIYSVKNFILHNEVFLAILYNLILYFLYIFKSIHSKMFLTLKRL